MNELFLSMSLESSRELVIEAFKQTKGINKYHQSEYQIVGKTGVSFPRVLWSYGESVYVDLSETEDPDRTKVTVSAEKEVSVNVGGNPQKFQRRFLKEIKSLRESEEIFSSGPDSSQSLSQEETERRSENNSESEITSLPISDDYTEAEVECVKAVVQYFEPNGFMLKREIIRDLFPDNPAGYRTEKQWWDIFVRPLLESHPAIEQAGTTDIRWSLTDEAAADRLRTTHTNSRRNTTHGTREVNDSGMSSGAKTLLLVMFLPALFYFFIMIVIF